MDKSVDSNDLTDDNNCSTTNNSIKSDDLGHVKTLLEIEILESRKALEKEKLEQEVEQLRSAPGKDKKTIRLGIATALLSSLTALSVAAGTAFVTWQVQNIVDQQKSFETYAALLHDLGSDSAPARAGGVIGLTRFAQKDKERAEQTIAILVTQLSSERDTRVIRVLVPSIVSLGTSALGSIARLNRDAYLQYRNDLADYVSRRLHPVSTYTANPIGERGRSLQEDAREIFRQFAQVILTEFHYQLLSEFGTVSGWFQSFWAMSAGNNAIFGVAAGIGGLTRPTQLLPAIDEARRLTEDARVLLVSSLVLSRIVSSQSSLAESPLYSNALLFVNWSNHRIQGLRANASFIAGNANNADLTGADFTDSNLSRLRLTGANLSFTEFENAVLPRATYKSEILSADMNLANLSGADWWRSFLMMPVESNRGELYFDQNMALRVLKTEPTAGQKDLITDQYPLWDCPTDERKIKEDELAILSFCPPQSEIDNASKTLESEFPRRENEERRAQWLKSHKPGSITENS
ncbi:hypothetical protein BYI23_A001880 [Burkholderia sp. YI23]|nr:hypothetical protein BYI23_A001880 [Burkholderia sp. YI23]